MGLLDRFGGTPERRFAHEVLAVLRGSGVAEAWFDPEHFAIGYRHRPDGGEAWLYLSNTFAECRGASRAVRRTRIARLVEGVVTNPGMPDGWEAAAPCLRPVLRPMTFGMGAPGTGAAPLSRRSLPYLSEMLVVDTPRAMAYVLPDHVERWGVTVAHAFATAHANLARLAAAPATSSVSLASERGRRLLRFVDDGDAYFTSRILLPGWLDGLAERVGGHPVAFVPTNTSLIVADDDPEHLPGLLKLVESEYAEAPRSLSPQAYTVNGDGRLIPYPAPSGHPAARAVSRSGIVLASSEYAAQRHWLLRRYQRDGVDVHIGELTVVRRPDDSLFTYAVWAEGVDALLPRADLIAFPTGVGDPFFVPWAAVDDVVGLVPAPDLYPDRYRVNGWPPAPVVSALRDRAVEP